MIDPRGLTSLYSNSSVGSYNSGINDLSLDLSITSQDLADFNAYQQYANAYEEQRYNYIESMEAQAHMASVQRLQEILSPSTLPIQQIFRPTFESPNFFSESRFILPAGNVNTYGVSADFFPSFGAGVDLGIYHDLINNEIGVYFAGEFGGGGDGGLDIEIGSTNNVAALRGWYNVVEGGAAGMSLNISQSDDGQKTTTINMPLLFPDNAGLPAGHAGRGGDIHFLYGIGIRSNSCKLYLSKLVTAIGRHKWIGLTVN